MYNSGQTVSAAFVKVLYACASSIKEKGKHFKIFYRTRGIFRPEILSSICSFFAILFRKRKAVTQFSWARSGNILQMAILHETIRKKLFSRMQKVFRKKKLFRAEKANENFTLCMRHTRTNVKSKYTRAHLL